MWDLKDRDKTQGRAAGLTCRAGSAEGSPCARQERDPQQGTEFGRQAIHREEEANCDADSRRLILCLP